jgi:AcrR family transcriptional regulator
MKLGRPRQVEDDAIFNAMTRVLLRAGWPRLTLSLVAREVGLTPAALRQRFGGKHDLLVAFYAWGTEQARGTLAAAVGPYPPLDALRGIVRTVVAPFSTPEQMVNAMSAFTEVATDAELRAMAQERTALTLDWLVSIVQRAIDCGQLRGVQADSLARQLHIGMIGACLTWSIMGHGVLHEEVLGADDAALAPYLCAVNA